MNKTQEQKTPIFEALKKSCEEASDMRQNKKPKRNMNELFSNIEKWKREQEEH